MFDSENRNEGWEKTGTGEFSIFLFTGATSIAPLGHIF